MELVSCLYTFARGLELEYAQGFLLVSSICDFDALQVCIQWLDQEHSRLGVGGGYVGSGVFLHGLNEPLPLGPSSTVCSVPSADVLASGQPQAQGTLQTVEE